VRAAAAGKVRGRFSPLLPHLPSPFETSATHCPQPVGRRRSCR
jgi:hypothetical protein